MAIENDIEFLHDDFPYPNINLHLNIPLDGRWQEEKDCHRKRLERPIPIAILILKLICIPARFLKTTNLFFNITKLNKNITGYNVNQIAEGIAYLRRLKIILPLKNCVLCSESKLASDGLQVVCFLQ